MADIRAFNGSDKLTQAAADAVLALALAAVRDRDRFVWGISGGPSIAMLLRMLADEYYSARMPWPNTYITFNNEIWVAPTESESVQRMAREELLDRVNIRREQVRAILTIGVTPEESAAVAERHVTELFKGPLRPDLLLLTIGDDGHTAGLFPGSGALLEHEALFFATEVPDTGETHITSTFRWIATARNIHFFVTGATKATAVQQALYPQAGSLVVPAALVQPTNGKVTWFLDADVAQSLQHTDLTFE
jgi:6-phosphogluconolactonase